MKREQSLPDVSVWFALTITGHTHHKAALAWFEGLPTGHSVHFCRVSQAGLLRLLTTEVVMRGYGRAPMTNASAMAQYADWLALDEVHWADEPADLDRTWTALAARQTASPKLWMDAYLAAFSINAGTCLVTCDKAMKQFTGAEVVLVG